DGAMVERDGDSPALSGWQFLFPVADFLKLVQDREEVPALEHRAAEFDRILPRRIGELVDEALEEEAVLRAAHRPPEAHRQMRILQHTSDVEVRDLIALIGQAIMRLPFHAVLERPPDGLVDRTHREFGLERRDLSVGRERCTEPSGGLRTK